MEMEYRNLGVSGLKVSALSFGSWVTFVNQLGEKTATDCMALSYERGINFFDNAEAYASGESEVLMGKILKKLKKGRKIKMILIKNSKDIMRLQTLLKRLRKGGKIKKRV